MEENSPDLELDGGDLVSAFDEGDATKVAKLLRERKSLRPEEIEALADMIDPSYSAGTFDPFCLKFVRRKKGAPALPALELMHQRQTRVALIKKHLKTEKKIELAIAAAAEELGVSISTLRKDWARYRKSVKKKATKSPIK